MIISKAVELNEDEIGTGMLGDIVKAI